MPYIHRTDGGVVDGYAKWPQEGWTGEQIAEDAPEFVAYTEGQTKERQRAALLSLLKERDVEISRSGEEIYATLKAIDAEFVLHDRVVEIIAEKGRIRAALAALDES